MSAAGSELGTSFLLAGDFFFFWASEEGSRCKITGLRDSYSFELELRVLLAFCCEMKWGAMSGRRQAALGSTPRGYLTPSKSAFVFPRRSYLQIHPFVCYQKPLCSITSTCFTRHTVALATEGHFETLKERQCCGVFFPKNFPSRWPLEAGIGVNDGSAQGFSWASAFTVSSKVCWEWSIWADGNGALTSSDILSC